MPLIQDAIDLVDHCARATDAVSAAQVFADRLQPYGLNGVGTRVYRRPEGQFDSAALFKAGGRIATVSPPGWLNSEGYRYICLTENPLLDAVKNHTSFFRFSDLAPPPRYATYWEAQSEGGIGDGIGLIHFGARRRVASLSLTFEQLDLSPGETAALRTAGATLLERTAQLTADEGAPPTLTPREHDCMAFVAAGKSDWDISVILGLSQTTVRFHVDNARRKLDASTRAHAVARMAAYGMI